MRLNRLIAALAFVGMPFAGASAAFWIGQLHATQNIASVALSGNTFTAGSSSGTVIGALSATMSPSSPAFSGSWSLVASGGACSGGDTTDFQISGSNLETNGTPAAGSYSVCVQATQAGISNSPYTVSEAITGSSSGDPTAGLLPADRSAWANWQMAGLQSIGGIPNRTTQCGSTVTPIGGGSDDTAAIQAAVNACTVGDYVQLSAGAFTITEGGAVSINKAVTVRGMGPCAGASGVTPFPSNPTAGFAGYPTTVSTCTLIQRSNGAVLGTSHGPGTPSPHFILGVSDVYANAHLGTGTALTADGAQGALTITVSSTSGFSVGEVVMINELSGMGWQPSWIWPTQQQWGTSDYRLNWRAQNPTCQPGDQACSGGSTPPNIDVLFGGGTATANKYLLEAHQIASINSGAKTITFDSPLTVAFHVANTAQIALIYGGSGGTTLPASQAGLENMTLQNADGSSVIIAACNYCWVKNVEDTVFSGYYTNGDIALEGSFRTQLEGVYSHLAWQPVSGGGAYNWSIDRGASECLIENSISMLSDKPMVVREAGAGCVVAYNYFDEIINGNSSDGQTEVGANASHWIGSHDVLFEGNWTFQVSGDPVWGPSIFDTWMRNDVTGYRSPFYDWYNAFTINDATSTPGGCGIGHNCATVVSMGLFDYWQSFVGNVLGTSGAMSGFTYYTAASRNNNIWSMGVATNDNDGVYDEEVWTPTSGASACVTTAGDQCPAIRLSDYDYVTNSLADPSNPTVPNSFYLASAPAFFSAGASCSYAWPWVNSQGATKVASASGTGCSSYSGLPAKARMDNGTPFSQP